MPRDSVVTPVTRRISVADTQSRGGTRFNIFKPGVHAYGYKPSWHRKHNIFRPLPGRLEEDTSQFDVFIHDEVGLVAGSWIRDWVGVLNFADVDQAMIIHDPMDPASRPEDQPLWVLHHKLRKRKYAGTSPPAWEHLVKGRNDTSFKQAEACPRPDAIYTVAGIIMMLADEQLSPPAGINPGDPLPVMLLSSTAGRSVLDQVFAVNNDGSRQYPDFVAFDQGVFLDVHQNGTLSLAGDVRQRQPYGAPTVSHYSVEVFTSCPRTRTPPNLSSMRDIIAPKILPWSQMIHVLSPEEQIQKIAQSDVPADAIVYALGGAFDLPDAVVRKATRAQAMAPDMSGVAAASPSAGVTAWSQPQLQAQPQPQAQPQTHGAPSAWGSAPAQAQPVQQAWGGPPPGARREEVTTHASGASPRVVPPAIGAQTVGQPPISAEETAGHDPAMDSIRAALARARETTGQQTK